MNKKSLNRYSGILLGLGIGIALAVALDNIAVGIAVGVVFLAGSALRLRRENDQVEESRNIQAHGLKTGS